MLNAIANASALTTRPLVQRRVPEGPVVVVGGALLEGDLAVRHGAHGPVEAVAHAPVHVARVELVERVVQRRVALQRATQRTL